MLDGERRWRKPQCLIATTSICIYWGPLFLDFLFLSLTHYVLLSISCLRHIFPTLHNNDPCSLLVVIVAY